MLFWWILPLPQKSEWRVIFFPFVFLFLCLYANWKGKVGPPEETTSTIRKPGIFTFSTNKNYAQLVDYAASLVSPGGYLITFSNTHSLTKQEYLLPYCLLFKIPLTRFLVLNILLKKVSRQWWKGERKSSLTREWLHIGNYWDYRRSRRRLS